MILQANPPSIPDSAALDQDGHDLVYFSAADFGSQGQQLWMLLDTGGTNTWVFSSDCASQSCAAHNTFNKAASTSLKVSTTTWSVGYGSGSVSGVMANDSMSLAGLDAQLDFGLVNQASNDFLQYPFDGILGLGRSTDSGSNMDSFMNTVAAAKLLKSNIMAVSLSRAAEGGKDGEVTFGAVDTSKYVGDITYTNALSNTTQWIIPLDDASANGTPCNFTGRTAIIDTGTSYVLVPPNDAQQLHALIPGAVQSGTTFVIPCTSNVTLRFIFSDVGYTISPLDYVGPPVAGSPSSCVSTIIGQQTFGPNEWLVGDVFLKNVYTVFDYDGGRVGFAERNQAVVAVQNSTSATSAAAGTTGTGSSASTSTSSSGSAVTSPVTGQLSQGGAAGRATGSVSLVVLIMLGLLWY